MNTKSMAIIALYVERGETQYRKFFLDNLFQLQFGFQKKGFNLIFLPALTQQQNPNFTEGLRQYLEVYYPSFQKLTSVQQQQALFIVASTSSEQEVYQQLDDMFGLNLSAGAYLFYLKPGHFEFERLPADVDPEVALADYLLPPNAHVSASMREPITKPNRKWQLDPMHLEEFMESQEWDPKETIQNFDFKKLVDDGKWEIPEANPSHALADTSAEFLQHRDDGLAAKLTNWGRDNAIITPELQRLFDTVNALNLDEGMRQLLDISLNRYAQLLGQSGGGLNQLLAGEQPMMLMQPLERVYFNYDGKLFVGDQKVALNPICRALYKLFLNHPEGIELPMLSNHREELHSNYLNMATHTNREVLLKRINAICDPRENSINEKLSTINKAFENLLGEQVSLPYQILGVRGEAKKINIRREFVG
jgi:hypothetical protein